MSRWSDFAEDYKGEMEEAKEYRNYGPWMAITVIVFWAIVISLVASTVDCGSPEPVAHKKDSDWH